jgi:hypothetical protein
MRTAQKSKGLPSTWGLVLVALLTACGSENNGQTVTVNLSLIVNARQAQQAPASRLFAWIERWFPGATPAWAQSVTEIASIQVQITGPGIPAPATTSVAVSNPASGQEIPVSIQAPVGPNRTITVLAFNAASPPLKIFGGTLPGVNLTAGAPVNLEITLVRLFTVAVQKQGNGSGTVTSTPAGIDCGTTCSSQFSEGTRVSLNAAAAPGSSFAGWSGDCSGTGACIVTGQSTVTARYIVPAATNHLHVDKAGTGMGTVSSEPSGISCGSSCDTDFESGAIVTLRVVPSDGSTFNSWSGAGCILNGPICTVVMNGDQTVTTTFTAGVPVPTSTLTVEKTGSGSGTVTSTNQSGINCGSTCSAGFPTGSVVTLTATPVTGSTFIGWSNGCAGTGSCDVTLNADQTIVAQFDIVPDLVTLTVNDSGPGQGTVSSAPAGIDCGGMCTFQFLRGTVVTLTAAPSGGSIFAGWRGDPCEAFGTGPCMITMDENRSANARFERFGGR